MPVSDYFFMAVRLFTRACFLVTSYCHIVLVGRGVTRCVVVQVLSHHQRLINQVLKAVKDCLHSVDRRIPDVLRCLRNSSIFLSHYLLTSSSCHGHEQFASGMEHGLIDQHPVGMDVNLIL